MNDFFINFFFSFLFSLSFCIIIVYTVNIHKRFTFDYLKGIQKFHTNPTPRIGGIAIFFALLLVLLVIDGGNNSNLYSILLASIPSFAIGFIEDLSKTVKVSIRFIITLISGFIAWYITGISIKHISITFIDSILLSTLIISILFTMFAIAGITHAINIIDGLNGIAGFTTIITLISIATIAYKVEDIDLVISSIYIIGALLGFLLFNWPFGKLFLGDGGSYFCGFCLSWSCILLVENNPSVSPFAPLLVCIYPVSESIFSIYRRIIRKQNPTGPDALHLHSLIFRRYSSRLNFCISKNSIVGFIISLFNILPCAAASYFSNNNLICFTLVLIFISLYIFIYIKILNFKLY